MQVTDVWKERKGDLWFKIDIDVNNKILLY